VDFEQPVRDVNSEVGVDADQVGVEGRVMEFRQGRRLALRLDAIQESRIALRVRLSSRLTDQSGDDSGRGAGAAS